MYGSEHLRILYQQIYNLIKPADRVENSVLKNGGELMLDRRQQHHDVQRVQLQIPS